MDENNRFNFIIISVIIISLIFFQKPAEPSKLTGPWDISEQVAANGYQQFLVEEQDFDYSSTEIQQIAAEIKHSSATPEDAVKQTLKFVVQNVRYSSKITINYCYNEKASDVLKAGTGDCVSMSRLATALLRAQGIPTRTMGGCLSASIRCDPLMAVIPGAEPQVTEMMEGDFKKRASKKQGFLHEWIEIWTPGKGWRIGEATSGQIYSMSCGTYKNYDYDADSFTRCVINDAQFWNQCYIY